MSDQKRSILVPAIGLGSVMCFVIAAAIQMAPDAKSIPSTEVAKDYELVRTCKPPMFRRATEFIIKDQIGQLYYTSPSGKVKIAPEQKLNDICKAAGRTF